jgi:hypothetical protein
MPYIEPSVIEQAKRIDLLTYLQQCEPSFGVLMPCPTPR